MAPPKLIITPRGNLGNQMLQFMLARSIQQLVPDLEIYGHSIENWRLHGRPMPRYLRLAPSTRMADPDLSSLARLLSAHTTILKYGRIPLRIDTFADRNTLSKNFPLKDILVDTAGPDEILINVRGAEILGNQHPDYGPIYIDFYRRLASDTGLRPLFLGQIGKDYYSDMLRRSFPTARFIESRGVDHDFQAVRLAEHIVPGISTFSWIAAWFSDAKTIHLPLLGFYNPQQRTDSWLIPLEDPRYRFYWFKERRWSATDDQIRSLDEPVDFQPVAKDFLGPIKRDNDSVREGLIEDDIRQLRQRAPISRFVSLIDSFMGD